MLIFVVIFVSELRVKGVQIFYSDHRIYMPLADFVYDDRLFVAAFLWLYPML